MVKVRDLVLSKGLTWSQICQSRAQSPQPDMVSPGAGLHVLWHGGLTVLYKNLNKMNQLSAVGTEQRPAGN